MLLCQSWDLFKVGSSVNRWLYYFYKIWSFPTVEICQIVTKYLPKLVKMFVNWKIKLLKLGKRLVNFAKMGKIYQIWSR